MCKLLPVRHVYGGVQHKNELWDEMQKHSAVEHLERRFRLILIKLGSELSNIHMET